MSNRVWEIASATDVGRRRQRNEDTVFVAEPLIGVCDGMGGHERGDLASQLAAEIIQHGVKQNLSLEQAMRDAGEAVYKTGRGRRGTTAVCALLHAEAITIVWAGDSRAYLTRRRSWEQLTQDHGVFGHLSSCLGITNTIPRLETRRIPVQPGDVLLLCSDGLTDMVSDQQIGRMLASGGISCDMIARELITQANASGGVDNISVIVARRLP